MGSRSPQENSFTISLMIMLNLYTNIQPPKGECSEDRIAQIGTGVSLRQCLKMKFETYRCVKEIADVSKELEIDTALV